MEPSFQRFIILQGGTLRYFKTDARTKPQATLTVTKPDYDDEPRAAAAGLHASIEANDECTFTVSSPDFPQGLAIKCADAAERDVWINAIADQTECTPDELVARASAYHASSS